MARRPSHTPEWQNPLDGDPGRSLSRDEKHDRWIDILSIAPSAHQKAAKQGVRKYTNVTLKRGMVLQKSERYLELRLRDPSGRTARLYGAQLLAVRDLPGDQAMQEWEIVYETIQR